jgi:uncharacterized membrane protein
MPGAGIPSLPTEPEFSVVSRRNDSLGSRWRWRLFASLCVVSFTMALAFAALGAWLVLPYAALEMTVLYLAFRWFERHASDWERVSVCGERVILERGRRNIYAAGVQSLLGARRAGDIGRSESPAATDAALRWRARVVWRGAAR